MTREKLIAELTEKLSQAPGYVPGFLHPIEGRILMLSTGIRAQVGVKILGDNLDALQKKAFEVEEVIRKIPGAAGVAPSRLQGKPYLKIVDRVAMARYGLRPRRARRGRNRPGRQERHHHHRRARSASRSRCASSGTSATTSSASASVLGSRPRPDSLSRSARSPRSSASVARARSPARTAGCASSCRPTCRAATSAASSRRPGSGSRGRSLCPAGMTIEWSGQYENQLRAQRTLQLIVPTVLVIIFLLLYIVYRSAKEAAHVILAVPFALTGGVFLQYLLGYNFSVAVWVGYIALFGTAIETGIVMVVYLEEALKNRRERRERSFGHADLIRGEGRRHAAAAAQGDDGRHHRRRPAADHVEHQHRLGSDAAAGHAGHRRHAQQPPAYPHCHSRHLLLAKTQDIEISRTDQNFPVKSRQKTLGGRRETVMVAADVFSLCLSRLHLSPL